ncbi:ferredoxin [Nocardioides acrostichi]|uniref:Ferredoxin n=1 Tax=Nocardioides acrostichi TaxID=2784339 RepID=A0A930V1S8_9ACTN|nr:ferredoxin [Nocardioides acrostichi]MBF4163105.1 ferredoxin [Nocardioides acrostichi]
MSQQLHVDENKCAGHALCTVIAPDLFEMDDRGKAIVIGQVDDANLAEAEEAVAECPALAIAMTSSGS